MKIKDLDNSPIGNKPLSLVIRFMRTALTSPAVAWNQLQRDAAAQACDEAETLLDKELSGTTDAEMHPVGTAERIKAMETALSAVNVRLCFMGWPAESFWNGGTAEKPHWIADWRKEIALMDRARHGTPLPLDKMERWQHDTTPHNRIPEAERPYHPGVPVPVPGLTNFEKIDDSVIDLIDSKGRVNDSETHTIALYAYRWKAIGSILRAAQFFGIEDETPVRTKMGRDAHQP